MNISNPTAAAALRRTDGLPVRARTETETFGALLSGLCLPRPGDAALRHAPFEPGPVVPPVNPGHGSNGYSEQQAKNRLLLAVVLDMRQALWAPICYRPAPLAPELAMARVLRRRRWIAQGGALLAAVAEGRPVADVAARLQLYYAAVAGAALPAGGGLVDVAV